MRVYGTCFVSRLFLVFCWLCIVMPGIAGLTGCSGGDGDGNGQSVPENNNLPNLPDSPLSDGDGADRYSLAVTAPQQYAEIGLDTIDVQGIYTHSPVRIRISIPRSPSGIEVIETEADLTPGENGGTFSGILEISDIMGNGNRSIIIEALYGASPAVRIVKTLPVILDREEWESGVMIESPKEGGQVRTNSLQVLGGYDGIPDSLAVTLTKNNLMEKLTATLNQGEHSFNAFFQDISGVENGYRTIEVTADYGGGIVEHDTRQVFVDRESTAGKSFSYRFNVSSNADDPYPVLVTRWDVCPSTAISRPGMLSSGVNISGDIQYPLVQDRFDPCAGEIDNTYERRVGVKLRYANAGQTPANYIFIVKLFVNGSDSPVYVETSENQSATLEVFTSWDGTPEHNVKYSIHE